MSCIQNITVLIIKNESFCENQGNTHSFPMKGFQKTCYISVLAERDNVAMCSTQEFLLIFDIEASLYQLYKLKGSLKHRLFRAICENLRQSSGLK